MNILDFLFPVRCVGCGKLGRYFCQKCVLSIEYKERQICPVCEYPAIDGMTHPRCQTKYSLDGLTSFFYYDRIIRKAIKAMKYRFVSDLAKEFIGLVPLSSLQLTMEQFNNEAILIPLPLHPSRLRFRGFNQAEVLGRLLAKRLNIPLKTNILKRIRKTTAQVEMKDREKRLKNMKNVFSVDQLTINNYQSSILLFDDVFTTGATMRAATYVLKRAGIKKVWGVTLAHG